MEVRTGIRACAAVAVSAAVLASCSYSGEATWDLGGTTPDESTLFVWYEEGSGLRDITVEETDDAVTVDVSVGRIVGPQGGVLNIGFELVELSEPLGDRQLRGCGHVDCREPSPMGLAPEGGHELRVAADRLLVPTGPDEVILDADTGMPVSDAPADLEVNEAASLPTVLDGRASVRTEDTGLFVEDLETGEPLLILSLLPHTQPIVVDDLIILGVADDQQQNGLALDAYHAPSGERIWRRPLPEPELVASKDLILHPDGSEVVALDAATGDERFRVATYLRVGRLVAEDGRVYASLWQGAAAIDAEDGSLLWWWQLDAGPYDVA